MRLRTEKSAQEIRLKGTPLGSGGEASIYAVPNRDELAAKIYHRPSAERAAKLTAMLAAPPDDPMSAAGHVSIAWPTELLFGDDGVAGYLMPRVHQARLIQEFYNPRARQRTCPLFHYGYLLRTARNLASAVRALHERGYVIGDINESNLLVTNQALVTLVDTDSFQVSAEGRIYRCRVGKAEYTAPELQGARFADIDRAAEHDCFGLGVLIFQLLMQGVHPFAGLYSGAGEPAQIPQRIAAGHWPYLQSRATPYRPSPHAPPLQVLPPGVLDLVRRCFDDGFSRPWHRPSAADWHQALYDAEKELANCQANTQHVYHASLGECPWCKLTRQQGRDPFPAAAARDRKRPTETARAAGAPVTTKRPTKAITSTPNARPAAYPVGMPVAASTMLPPSTRFVLKAFAGGIVVLTLAGAGVLGWSLTHKEAQRDSVADAVQQGPHASRSAVTEKSALPMGAPQPLRRFEGHTGRVTCVAFSPDGQRFLSGSTDLTIRLWDMGSGKELRRYVGHTHWVKSLAFTPDGQRFLSAGFDKTVRLWEVDSGQQLSRIDARDQVMSVAVAADGRSALSGSYDENVRVWDLRDPRATWNQQRFWLRDMVNSVAVSEDGKLVLCAGSDHTFRLWDIPTGRELRRFTGHTGVVNSVALSTNGRRALSGSADASVRLWDIESGRELRRCTGHDEEITAVAFVGSGQRFVSGSGDNTVRLWDADTGLELRRFKADVLGVTSVTVHGAHLLSGGGDASIHLWRLSGK